MRVVAGTALLLLVVAGCIRLGFWQLERLEQRQSLNARVARRMQAPVLEDRLLLPDTAVSLYRRATVTGRYDDERSIVLPGRAFNGVPGVHLLTPLLLDAEAAVLVNRGWVPSADAATIPVDSFPAGQPGQDAARLTGIVLPLPFTEPRPVGQRTGDGASFRRVWYHLDLAQLQAQFPYRLLPLQLQLLPRRGDDSASERSRRRQRALAASDSPARW
jgi:surfeit locus 1 family protein